MHTYSNSILRSKIISTVSSTFELRLRAKRHQLQATVTTHTSILVPAFITPFQDPCDFFLQLLQIAQSTICCSIFLPFILSGIAVYHDFDLSLCSVFFVCSIPLSLPFTYHILLLNILENASYSPRAFNYISLNFLFKGYLYGNSMCS